jgi:MSHA pilin protein MshD
MSVHAHVSKGFTLVETIVAMVLISIAALAMASVLGVAFSHSSDSLFNTKTVQLAQAYIEEIQSRRFDETTPLGGTPPCSAATITCSAVGPDGEARTAFDDVDDYHGLNESPPRNAAGAVLSEFSGFRVQVAVSYPTAAQVTAWQLDDASDAKVVVVTVVTPEGKSRDFPFVRGNF